MIYISFMKIKEPFCRHFTFSLSLHFHFTTSVSLRACRRWRSLARRSGFSGVKLSHRTCKTSPGWLQCRTCKTSPGWLPGFNFPRNPFNEFSENTKNLQNFHIRRIRYFWVQNSKNPDPPSEFFFLGSNPPTC